MGGARQIIELDAAPWKGIDDFYDALLPALGAPKWHGRNLDALWDSIVRGEINSVEPPYEICLLNTEHVSESLRSKLTAFLAMIEEAGEREGIDVRATATPPL